MEFEVGAEEIAFRMRGSVLGVYGLGPGLEPGAMGTKIQARSLDS